MYQRLGERWKLLAISGKQTTLQLRVIVGVFKPCLIAADLGKEAVAIHKLTNKFPNELRRAHNGSSHTTVIASGSRRLVTLATEGALRGCHLPFHARAHARERPLCQNFRKREKSIIRTPLQGRTV